VLCIVSQSIVGTGEVVLVVVVVVSAVTVGSVGTLVALSFPRRRDPRFFLAGLGWAGYGQLPRGVAMPALAKCGRSLQG